MTATVESVRVFVAGHLGVPAETLAPTALLGEDLALDSLAAIELAMAVEEEFGVGLADDELARMHTYGELESTVLARAGTAR